MGQIYLLFIYLFILFIYLFIFNYIFIYLFYSLLLQNVMYCSYLYYDGTQFISAVTMHNIKCNLTS